MVKIDYCNEEDYSAKKIQKAFRRYHMKITIMSLLEKYDQENIFNAQLIERIFKKECIVLFYTKSYMVTFYFYKEILHLFKILYFIMNNFQLLDKKRCMPVAYRSVPDHLIQFFDDFTMENIPLWWKKGYYGKDRCYLELYAKNRMYPKSRFFWQIEKAPHEYEYTKLV